MTLLAKTYSSFQQKLAEEELKARLEGLKVEVKVTGIAGHGWIQAAVSGEDETVASRLLQDWIGVCPANLDKLERFSTIRGSVTALNKGNDRLYVDIGVFSPSIVNAAVPVNVLQAQIADGRKVAFKKIVELFEFCDNLPLTVKISSLDGAGYVEAVLAESQLARYTDWRESLLDRLVVLGMSSSEVEAALAAAECKRDVVDVEPLGLFEHAVVCKLGTDAAGLIPKVGRRLRNAAFSVFNPRKINEFLEAGS